MKSICKIARQSGKVISLFALMLSVQFILLDFSLADPDSQIAVSTPHTSANKPVLCDFLSQEISLSYIGNILNLNYPAGVQKERSSDRSQKNEFGSMYEIFKKLNCSFDDLAMKLYDSKRKMDLILEKHNSLENAESE